jgi:hypothetical protein
MNFRELMLEQKRLILDTSELLDISHLGFNHTDHEELKDLVDFDKDRVVMWVIERKKGSKLIAGQKVIRLGTRYKSGEIQVLFWNGKKYDFDKIRESSLSNLPVVANLKANFVNDISHVLHRVSHYKSTQKDDILADIIAQINPQKNALISKITDRDILLLNDKFREKYKVNFFDRVQTIKDNVSAISSIINPKDKDERLYSDTTLFVPLSISWFKNDTTLKEYYENTWAKDGALNRLYGSSGEGVSVASESESFDKIRKELLNLKEIVRETMSKDSNEAQWLQKLNTELLASKYRMIFVHEDPWHLNYEQRQADDIGLMSTLGIIQAPPLMSVLIHEMNVNKGSYCSFFPNDSHIDRNKVQESWEKSKSFDLFVKNINNITHIDHLYQSYHFINAFFIALVLKNIK